MGRIEVWEDRLRIVYPAFREPFEIPREAIRVVAGDSRPQGRRWFTRYARFRIPDLGGEPSGWRAKRRSGWLYVSRLRGLLPIGLLLLDTRGSSPLPFLGHVNGVPNLAIVFDRPLPAPRVRRAKRRTYVGVPPLYHVRGEELLHGVLVRAVDLGAVYEALRPWGVIRPFGLADVEDLKPTHRQRRRALVSQGIVVGYTSLSLTIGGFALAPPRDENPRFVSDLRPCDQVRALPAYRALRAGRVPARLPARPLGPSRPAPTRATPLPDWRPLPSLLAPRRGPGGSPFTTWMGLEVRYAATLAPRPSYEARLSELLAHGYRRGLRHHGERSDRAFRVDVYEMAGPRHARAATLGLLGIDCRFSQLAFKVPGLRDAVGLGQPGPTQGSIQQVYFARDRYVFLAGVAGPVEGAETYQREVMELAAETAGGAARVLRREIR